MNAHRPSSRSGIAIGPILFVVAILAVLVGVIASGSGGFTASSSDESLRLKATTLIQQASMMKIAADRITANGYQGSQITGDLDGDGNNDVDVTAPLDDVAMPSDARRNLFAPTGGGVSAPKAPDLPGANTSTNPWMLRIGPVDDVGGIAKDLYAIKYVGYTDGGPEAKACDQINSTLKGRNSDGTAPAITFAGQEVSNDTVPAIENVNGRLSECIESDGADLFFYAVLAIDVSP